ncbi:geranylgeranyl transferase type-1 subunit beta-like isoform X1 [Magnolia sinica]|uniref:geranylgeranyl transferase type-1 subunit beta-like isoform X1 n=1 Tax=Magnolia sinica TaxID=86752 RepID=UPI00265A1C1B|nr:geranylgeranyl transferase type-1 subunit beta-like isoform X1 [Magnolia sinica]
MEMDSSGLTSSSFDKDRHITFLEMMVHTLPADYQEQDINRLTLAYFAISGLDILNALDRIDKDGVVNWVLSLQEHPSNESELENGEFYGFHSSRTSQFQAHDVWVLSRNDSHLASTYCALAILKMVGYDLLSIDSESIVVSMKHLQQPDGSFMPIHTGAEKDLRFIYCAAAICSMLNNWSGMDRKKAKEYILNCQSYDGGFGLVPGSESHGGATYCAVAALRLMGFIKDDSLSKFISSSVINVPALLEWSLERQTIDGGFQGRTNKPSDTCYAFWVGGVLKILGAHHFFDKDALRAFLLSCQTPLHGSSPSLSAVIALLLIVDAVHFNPPKVYTVYVAYMYDEVNRPFIVRLNKWILHQKSLQSDNLIVKHMLYKKLSA